MLNKPNINELMSAVDSKYALVVITAKRARYTIDRDPDAMSSGSNNAVSMALNDVVDGKLHWDFGESQSNS